MTISKKTIPIRDDVVCLRISSDAKWLAAIHPHVDSSLDIHKVDDDSISYAPRRKEAWTHDIITDLFAISPNGRYVAVCYDEVRTTEFSSMEAYIWDNHQQAYLPPFISKWKMKYKSFVSGSNNQRGHIYIAIQFLPDNDRLITVTEIGEAFVWSISQQKLLWVVSAAAHLTDSVAFSNRFGLFAMSDNQSKLWKYGQIGQHTTSFNKILYKQYGKWVASEPLNLGHSFRLWNTYSGTLIREFDADYWVNDLVFSYDDKHIAGSMKQTGFIWDVNTGEVVDALPENTKPIAFIADDLYLVTIHDSSSIGLWNTEKKQWEKHYQLDALIISAQVSQNDLIVALVKTINDWQLHQIQL
jgi:hypothetical protein